jgi:hypothetical protein
MIISYKGGKDYLKKYIVVQIRLKKNINILI